MKNSLSLREKAQEEKRKKNLAESLLNGEIKVHDLKDNEVGEMTDYFEKEIEQIDTELAKIKAHILDMKNQL